MLGHRGCRLGITFPEIYAMQVRAIIEAALKRIDEGDYGYCAECGEPIPEKRLKIDLTATRCAGCAA